MTDGVNENQAVATPEKQAQTQNGFSERARENFARLEAARDAAQEARIRAEMEKEQLQRELEQIKEMLKPKEKDPLDEIDDYVDPARLKAKLEKERAAFERKAEEIAKKTYEEKKREDEQRNFLGRLRNEFRDYDEVMNETNIVSLEQKNPIFLETVMKIADDYERRYLTYKYLKSNNVIADEKPSIKEIVEENIKNPHYIPSGSGTPAAVEFDVKSKKAREEAYARLKASQRRPINGQTR